MKQILLFLIWVSCVGSVNSQIINKVPLSDRQTGYTIDASLNIKTKTVEGSMQAFWVNKSRDIVPDIQMHLYINAFRDAKSTMNIEMPAGSADTSIGKVGIKSFKDRSGHDLLPLMTYISPDDANENDRTVIDVRLPEPARPGDTVFLNIDFETRLPHLSRRTGYNKDFFFVAQWFPKFGVYESAGMRYAMKGAWNCHQFHSNSEFYSNHSLYKVKITVPREFVVGSCGLLMTAPDTTGELKTLTYRAEDIVDFAWTAWPGFAEYTDQWRNVQLRLLLPRERAAQVKREFTALKNAMEYFDKNVGPYPWPYVTVVDPPVIGARCGGMEYTTMFTTLSVYLMPEFIHLPEVTTIHEFGHAYFMGILASNEFEEPWLDEGVNSFWEVRIADKYYGPDAGMSDRPFIKTSDKSVYRFGYIHSEKRQYLSNKENSWHYPFGTYGMMSYYKTATWLNTLMGLVGEETINEVFREYYKKWAFKNPSGQDFINVVNEVVPRKSGNKFGPDMNWFFDQTLYGTGICDYKVTSISNDKIEQEAGLSGTDSLKKALHYKSGCELSREGEIMLPVDVLVHFNNGDEIRESWDGKSRFKTFVYTGLRKIEWVKIDPDFKITMDVNYVNNSMTMNRDKKPVSKLTNKLMAAMEFLISIVSL